jgi:hypothetical protein
MTDTIGAMDAEAQPDATRRALNGLGVAAAGAAAIGVLGGPLSLTAGLLAVAALLGWVIGRLTRPSLAVGIVLAVGSVGLGLVAIWLFARSEGGVLPLLDYLADVQGVLAPLDLLIAGLAAAAAGR